MTIISAQSIELHRFDYVRVQHVCVLCSTVLQKRTQKNLALLNSHVQKETMSVCMN